MSAIRIGLALSGDPVAVARALLAQHPWANAAPVEVRTGDRTEPVRPDWIARLASAAGRQIVFTFSKKPHEYVQIGSGSLVKATCTCAWDATTVLRLLEAIPFEVASFLSIHPEWEELEPPYYGPSFSDGHFSHGWACAFKGVGHQRLVSRRWLEHGPWLLLKGREDLSMVQFHDLNADAKTALTQAQPGHKRMGITPVGGYIQTGYVYEHDLRGLYDLPAKLLKIVIHGRNVSPREMLDASAALRFQALGPGQPLERIAFVFLEPERARAHLEEVWLHGLECWSIIDGVEVDLTEGYQPPVPVIEWPNRDRR